MEAEPTTHAANHLAEQPEGFAENPAGASAANAAGAPAGNAPDAVGGGWSERVAAWPTSFVVKALFGNGRFVGEVRVERVGDRVTVSGKRMGYALYWARFWLIVALIGVLALPPVQELGVTAMLNLLSVLMLVTVGGRVLLIGTAKRDSVSFAVSRAARPSVGLRVRGLHVLLVGFSGLAALVVFALYRGGRRTVSVEGDRGDGDPVRYLFMARDEEQAIKLAALLLP